MKKRAVFMKEMLKNKNKKRVLEKKTTTTLQTTQQRAFNSELFTYLDGLDTYTWDNRMDHSDQTCPTLFFLCAWVRLLL